MAFGMVSIILLVLAALCVLGSLRLLFATGWFMQFLRGFAGFGLLVLALLVVMIGINLAGYAQLGKGGDLANVSFTRVNEQLFEATVVPVLTGEELKYTVEGDLWQMEGRQLNVAGSSTPFYMPQRITGRFFSIEQQRISAPSTFVLPDNSMGLNLWSLFADRNIGVLSAVPVKTRFVPMADGAMYSVKATANGIEAKPVNEAAISAGSVW